MELAIIIFFFWLLLVTFSTVGCSTREAELKRLFDELYYVTDKSLKDINQEFRNKIIALSDRLSEIERALINSNIDKIIKQQKITKKIIEENYGESDTGQV